MSLSDLLLGKPLKTSDERAEQIGSVTGVPIFGLDALSSAGYGPEAALTLLISLGAAGLHFVIPITAAIILLLTIVYFSYLQTIAAYPGGGGSYTVARENLGVSAGQLAAAALMIDYVLTVAVGISAGVGALVSAFPFLLPHTLELCLAILLLIALNQHAGRSRSRQSVHPSNVLALWDSGLCLAPFVRSSAEDTQCRWLLLIPWLARPALPAPGCCFRRSPAAAPQ